MKVANFITIFILTKIKREIIALFRMKMQVLLFQSLIEILLRCIKLTQTIIDYSCLRHRSSVFFLLSSHLALIPRTAGFNTIDIGSMEEASLFFARCLMFIGAGSASTDGGITLTTFIAFLLTPS